MKKSQILLALSAISLIVILGMIMYSSFVKERLALTNTKTLSEVTLQQKNEFKSHIKSEFSALQAVSASVSNHFYNGFTDIPSEHVADFLHEIAVKTDFEILSIINSNGYSINSENANANLSSRDYFNRSLRGETILSEPIVSVLRGMEVFVLSTPIYLNDEIIGVLAGSYKRDALNNLFFSSFDGRGYAFVVNKEGDIIAKTTNSFSLTLANNYFKDLSTAKFSGGESYDSVAENVRQNGAGNFSYILNGQERFANYMPIDINDWYIFSIVPADVLEEQANEINAGTQVLVLVLFLVFTIFGFTLLMSEKRQINMLSYFAYVDELTGLSNFRKFKEDAAKLMLENPDTSYIFFKLDVDKFKLINEIYGFKTGDTILKNLALSIKNIINTNEECFSRINIDEFVIMMKNQGEEKIRQIRKQFEDSFYESMGSGFEYKLVFPTGLYVVENGETNIDVIFEKVNYAHRRAKKLGFELIYYSGRIREEALREKDIENRMEHALQENQFCVYLQLKYALKDNSVAGAEALVRWKTNDGIMSPGEFIPVFERNGFITKLDFYMLEKSCQIIKHWIEIKKKPVTVSVNFSRLHLQNQNFVKDICAIVDKCNIPRDLIEIEITETVIQSNEDSLMSVLTQLHKEGFTLSMDDFGSGYSSLGLLKNLPVDVIKIDRTFFICADDEQRGRAVVETVMDMAKRLSIVTVAEGVENKEHIDFLREIGCDIVQGYYFARPVPAEQTDEKLLSI